MSGTGPGCDRRQRQNIGSVKTLVWTKYWRQQNIGVSKILASTKHWRRQNIGGDKV
jgi:hypothetical protein